jgi:hypothetical protein
MGYVPIYTTVHVLHWIHFPILNALQSSHYHSIMTPTSILLRGGTVLTHGNHDQVIPVSADVLIQGNKIAKIAPNIEATAGTVVVQCADKILSPGFIDTHHHLWQSLLKGRHANESLVEYFPSGLFHNHHPILQAPWLTSFRELPLILAQC